MKATLPFLHVLWLVALVASCQQKPKPKVATRRQPFTVDSICVLSSSTANSMGGYRTKCCDYILSDSVSQTFFRRMKQKDWKGLRVLTIDPVASIKQYLDYSVIDGGSHYDQLLVEFYYFWPPNLSVGRAEFHEPDTFVLQFKGEIEHLRIPQDSAKRNFNFIRYFLQVPEANAASKRYKILFDCGGISGCTIYQSLPSHQSNTPNLVGKKSVLSHSVIASTYLLAMAGSGRFF